MRDHLVRGVNPSVWLLLLGATSLLCLRTSNPLLLLLLSVAMVTTGLIFSGPRLPFLRLAVAVAVAVLLFWFVWTLVAEGEQSSALVLQRPALDLGAGVRLGGDLTLAGLLEGITNGLRGACLVLVIGLAGQCVSGRAWAALADNTLGGLSPLVWPLCRVPEAFTVSQQDAARARAFGHGGTVHGRTLVAAMELASAPGTAPDRPGGIATTLRTLLVLSCFTALLLFSATQRLPAALSGLTGVELTAAAVGALMLIGTALGSRNPDSLRLTRMDVPVLVASVFVATVVVTGESLIPGTALAPPPGSWPELPLAAALVVAALPASVAVGTMTTARRPTWPEANPDAD